MSSNFGDGSVMAWGTFAFNGKMSKYWVPKKMNAQMSRNLLELVLDGHGDIAGGQNFIFQYDNTAVHSCETG